VHHGGAPSSIWIFVERYLVRNFFPCNFQSSRTRSLLSLQRNKKMAFRIYNIDKLQLNGSGPIYSQAEM